MITRTFDKLTRLTADQSYDWWLLRKKFRLEGLHPLIREIDVFPLGQQYLVRSLVSMYLFIPAPGLALSGYTLR